MPANADDLLAGDAYRTVAAVDPESGKWSSAMTDDEPACGTPGLVRVFVGPTAATADLGADVILIASTRLVLPDDDADSDGVHEISVDFYEGEFGPVVALVLASAIPRSVALATIAEIADDLHRERMWMAEHGSDWNLVDVAKDVRWVAVATLRDRIRGVEESVRLALADEHVSADDYEALREYRCALQGSTEWRQRSRGRVVRTIVRGRRTACSHRQASIGSRRSSTACRMRRETRSRACRA